MGDLYPDRGDVPVRQQTPIQHIEVPTACVRVTANNDRTLRRRDVPGRREVRQRVHRAEDARDGLSGQKAGVAAAHGSDSCRTDPGWASIFGRPQRPTGRPLLFALCSSYGCRQRICPRTARRHPR
jgi:hypothetical protein